MIQLDIKFLSKDVDGVFSVRCDINRYTMYGIPRDRVQEAINKMPEGLQGIYFLVNTNDDKSKNRYLYIGQTKQGPERLIDHRQKRKGWNMAYMFLANKLDFSLQLADELEAYEILRFFDSGKYNLENKRPNKAIPSELASQFSESIEEVLHFFGYDPYPEDKIQNERIKSDDVFVIKRNGVEGVLEVRGGKYILLAGSKISKTCKEYISKNVKDLREKLNKEHGFDEDGILFKTKQDLEFDSPSSASDFVTGASTNGWTEFKNAEGMTLHEIVRKK